MTKQEIIDYVMTTPSNPNKAVLEGMLDSFSDGEGDGGSSRVLLYENDALDISTAGAPGIYFTGNGKTFPLIAPTSYAESDVFTLEIDGALAISSTIAEITKSGSTMYVMGIESPADTDGITRGLKAGFGVNKPDSEGKVYVVTYVNINDKFITAGTHSVKIYREVQ